MVIAEGYLSILRRTTEASPTTTLVIGRLRPAPKTVTPRILFDNQLSTIAQSN